jgi:DNA-binding transcriptional MerR regulator
MPIHQPNEPLQERLIDDLKPRYRSGAAARMARMPVATLRTWERRFQVVAPLASPSGHRLYSAADVHKLTLLKQLSDMGHAISHLAGLGIEQLRDVATTHATLQARRLDRADSGVQAAPRPWLVVVVGRSLAERLHRSVVLQRLEREVEVLGPFASLAECRAAAPGLRGEPDLVLVERPTLLDDDASELRELALAWRALQGAVLCTYAMPSACDAARRSGYVVQRAPISEEALADWLHWLSRPDVVTPGAMPFDRRLTPRAQLQAPAPWSVSGTPPPRRFDDATLADLAALSSSVACECPRNVSELLIQLSAFETYSGQCASQSSVDAELHRYLERTAASARALLEIALERIALHEGLLLKA